MLMAGLWDRTARAVTRWRQKQQQPVTRHTTREVLRWIRAADRLFWGHVDIVDTSSIYRRFRRPSDRLDIVDTSTMF